MSAWPWILGTGAVIAGGGLAWHFLHRDPSDVVIDVLTSGQTVTVKYASGPDDVETMPVVPADPAGLKASIMGKTRADVANLIQIVAAAKTAGLIPGTGNT